MSNWSKILLGLVTFLTVVNAVTNVRTIIQSQCYFHMTAEINALRYVRESKNKDAIVLATRVYESHRDARVKACTLMYEQNMELK